MIVSWGGRALIAVAALCGAGWLARAPLGQAMGEQLVTQDALEPADAIVVLGGDADHRAPQGAALYHRHLAPVLLAVGGTQSDQHYQARRTRDILQQHGVPDRAILVAGQYEASTAQEALAVADYAIDRGWQSVIVVTSPYHTSRASRIFRQLLGPHDVEVRLSAAPDDPFDPRRWWSDPRQRRQVRNEYLKLALWTVAGQ